MGGPWPGWATGMALERVFGHIGSQSSTLGRQGPHRHQASVVGDDAGTSLRPLRRHTRQGLEASILPVIPDDSLIYVKRAGCHQSMCGRWVS